jgi:hypothetical protein
MFVVGEPSCKILIFIVLCALQPISTASAKFCLLIDTNCPLYALLTKIYAMVMLTT